MQHTDSNCVVVAKKERVIRLNLIIEKDAQ